MHYRLIVAALLATTMFGCATSPVDVRRSNRQADFTVQENYQAVYRKVLDNARECFPHVFYVSPHAVQGEIYSDIKSGTVTVSIQSGMGTITTHVFDINAIDESNTKVTSFFKNGDVMRQQQTIKSWAAGVKICS